MARISWFCFCCCTKIQAPELLVHAILRRGVDFAFDLDPFAEVDKEAHFDAGGLEIVDQL